MTWTGLHLLGKKSLRPDCEHKLNSFVPSFGWQRSGMAGQIVRGKNQGWHSNNTAKSYTDEMTSMDGYTKPASLAIP